MNQTISPKRMYADTVETAGYSGSFQSAAANPTSVFAPVSYSSRYKLVYLDNIERSVTFTPEARQFIQERDLSLPLATIRKAIDEYFDENCDLAFDVFSDPDDLNEKQLVITIATSLTAKEAYRKLKHFDHEWWYERPSSLHKQITITVESK